MVVMAASVVVQYVFNKSLVFLFQAILELQILNLDLFSLYCQEYFHIVQ